MAGIVEKSPKQIPDGETPSRIFDEMPNKITDGISGGILGGVLEEYLVKFLEVTLS